MHSEPSGAPPASLSKILSQRGAGLLDNAPLGIVLVDESAVVLAANRAAKAILSLADNQVVDTAVATLFPPGNRDWVAQFVRDCFQSERGVQPKVLTIQHPNGDPLFLEISASVSPLSAPSRMAFLAFHDVTERETAKLVRINHNQVLENLAEGTPLESILQRLVETAERARPQMLVALQLVDEDSACLRAGSAPRLPEEFVRAIDGLRIEAAGPAPAAAAHSGQRVVQSDLADGTAWDALRAPLEKAGLRAAWAEPIVSGSGKVRAVFSLFYQTPQAPAAEDLQVVQTSAHLAGIALTKHEVESSLRHARETLEARVKERTEELRAANESLRQEIAKHEQTEAELLRERALLTNLMDTIPDKVYFKDLQSRFIRISKAHANQFGLKEPGDAIGKTDFDYHSEFNARNFFREEQEIIRTGKPVIGKEERLVLMDGSVRWASATKVPLRNEKGEIIGTFGISRDITRSKIAEEALVEERNLLRTLIDILPSRIFVKDRESRYLINNRAHLKQLGVVNQEETIGKTTRDFFTGQRGDQALTDDAEVMNTGKSIVDREKSDLGEKDTAHWSLTTKVPLRDSHNRIVGLVGMSHDITARKRAEEELRQKNEEMQADLKMAFEIQHSFLPHEYPVFPSGARPEESGLKFCHRYLPASTLAGDFFDIFAVSDQEAGILVSDVMGHGVRASLITAYLRGLMEELMPLARNPGNYLTELNRGLTTVLRQAGSPLFATAFYCVLDIGRGEVRYANAGHPSPLCLRRSEARVERLRPVDFNPEPALGLIDEFSYTSSQAPLQPQDAVLLFTDGLYEIDREEDGEQFGEERLEEETRKRLNLPAERLLEALIAAVKAFADKTVFPDDVCLVAAEAANVPSPRQPLLFDV